MRLLLPGLAAALVMALVPAAPAAATTEDHYHTATSTSDSAPRKAVTVTCPEGQIVYGFGGATVNSDGHAALTGIFPNEALTSVTAIAQARGGWTGAWSVMAVATCWPPAYHALERVMAIGGWAAVPASCPGDKVVYSSGYLVSSTTGWPYVDSVVPASDLSSVLVHGGGVPAADLRLTAVALCGFPIAGPYPYHTARTQVTVPVGAGTTTTATAPPPHIQFYGAAWVFGAGVSSTRPGMFIDALGPGPALAGGWARMARADSAARMAGTEGDEDEVTAYGTCIGSWY